jgi:hypothetical protein
MIQTINGYIRWRIDTKELLQIFKKEKDYETNSMTGFVNNNYDIDQ